MMHRKNENRWKGIKLIFFIPIVLLLLQAFARPELITKSEDFIPLKYKEDNSEKWLSKWTLENIGKGFYEPDLESPDSPKNPNNVLVILMNRRNELLIENRYAKKEDVKKIVKDFLNGLNPDGKKGPDYAETDIPLIGKVKVSKGIISFRNDLDTSKDEMNQVLKSIGEACLEVRKEKAQMLFGKDYFELYKEKQEAINMAVPVWFSIEKPKVVKKLLPPPKVIEVK